MRAAAALFVLLAAHAAYGDYIREIQVFTSDCNDCGMTTLGQLSAMVCGLGDASDEMGMCCVAHKLATTQDDFVEGELDIFTGPDTLKECYNFELGEPATNDDMKISLYHSGTDGGKFDYVTVVTDENRRFRCTFSDFFFDGSVWHEGTACQLTQPT